MIMPRPPVSVCYASSSDAGSRRDRAGRGGVRRDGWLYRVLVALSGITLVLVVAYIILIQENRSVQAEVNQRQQFINQSIQLGRINETLIRNLAAAAVNNKDDRLRDLLTQNGITINAAGEAIPTASKPAAESTP